MRSGKKLVLAAVVGLLMFAMFSLGLNPLSTSGNVEAAEGDGRISMVDLLDLVLGVDKQLTSVSVTFPRNNATMKIQLGATQALMPVKAIVSPPDEPATVAFGLDGNTPSAGRWTGNIVSSFFETNAPPLQTIDLAALSTASLDASAHKLYALGRTAKIDLFYEVIQIRDLIVEVVGALPNPFSSLGPGDMFFSTLSPVQGETKITVITDLAVPDSAGGLPVNVASTVSVPIAMPDGTNVLVEVPGLGDLIALGAVSAGDSAVLIVEVAPSLESLAGATASNAPPLPSPRAFNAPFVNISIIRSSNDVNFTQLTSLPDGVVARIVFSGLNSGTPTLSDGAAVWSHPSEIGLVGFTGTETTLPTGEDWVRREDGISVLEGPANDLSLEVILTELSVFTLLSTQFVITGVDPPGGPSAGQNVVSINGSFPINNAIFNAGAAASFYSIFFGDPANLGTGASFNVGQTPIITASSMLVRVPPLVAKSRTPVNVWLFDNNAPSDFTMKVGAYTYYDPPSISGFSPDRGTENGGTAVTITGTNLFGVTGVTVAGFPVAPGDITEGTGNTLTILTPAAPLGTTGVIEVTTFGGTAASTGEYVYTAAPIITSFSPTEGSERGGTEITIIGLNLLNINSVSVAGVDVQPVNIFGGNGSTLVVITETAAAGTTGPIEINALDGSAVSTVNYVYTAEPPTLLDFSPKTGSKFGGTQVTIEGTFLGNNPSVTVAGFSASINSLSNTRLQVITAPAPTGTTGPVVVATEGGVAVSSGFYEYREPPLIIDFTPKEGPVEGGTQVTIRGENFVEVVAIAVAGVPVSGFTRFSQTEIVATTGPTNLNRNGPVVVTTSGGQSVSEDNYRYLGDAAARDVRVDNVVPNNAWAFGGIVARITGQGFTTSGTGRPSVFFGAEEAQILGTITDSQLLVRVPSVTIDLHGEGRRTVQLTVSTDDVKTKASDAVPFFYYRIRKVGNITTTASLVTGGAGSIEFVLEGEIGPATRPVGTVELPFPVVAVGDRYALIRASNSPADFGLGLPELGVNVNGLHALDIHLYREISVPLPQSGMSLLEEVTAETTLSPDEPALIFSPVLSGSLTQASIEGGEVALVAELSSLRHDYPSDVVTFTPGTIEEFQSTILNDEFTAQGGIVDGLTGTRLLSLGSVAVRVDVNFDFDALGIEVVVDTDPFGGETPNGRKGGGTRVTLRSEKGGLGYVERIAFGSRNGTLVPGTFRGENEFFVQVDSPASADMGGVDLRVFLTSSPENPVVILPDAFIFTDGGDDDGESNPFQALIDLITGIIQSFFGFFSGNGGNFGGPCFIATAAYGTPMASEIDSLRDFRDVYLMDSALGTAFVDTYYRVSPPLANVIENNSALAAAVRVLLVPVVFFAGFAVAAPFATLGAGLALILLVMAYRRRRSLRIEKG